MNARKERWPYVNESILLFVYNVDITNTIWMICINPYYYNRHSGTLKIRLKWMWSIIMTRHEREISLFLYSLAIISKRWLCSRDFIYFLMLFQPKKLNAIIPSSKYIQTGEESQILIPSTHSTTEYEWSKNEHLKGWHGNRVHAFIVFLTPAHKQPSSECVSTSGCFSNTNSLLALHVRHTKACISER